MNTDDRALADLKPCRLCGGESERYTVMPQPEYANRQVRCRSCTASAFDDDWQRPALGDDYKLPCDVHLPPATVVAAGCDLATLKLAMELDGRPRKFDGNPRNALPADRLEAFHAMGERGKIALALVNEARRFSGFAPYDSLEGLEPHKYRDQLRYADAVLAALQSPPPVVSGEASDGEIYSRASFGSEEERQAFIAGVLPVVEEGRREAVERDIRIAIWNAGKWQGKPDEVAQSLIRKAMAEPTMIRALSALSTPVAAQGDEVREALVEDAAPLADAASHYSAAQIEEMESQVEHLRKEIHRCDAAIEGGDSDPWWREDRSRLQQRLDDLSAALATLGAPHEG